MANRLFPEFVRQRRVVAIDGSSSVPQQQFRQSLNIAKSLALTRAGDTIIWLRLEDPTFVQTTVFSARLTQHGREVVGEAKFLAGHKKRERGGFTLFASTLNHIAGAIWPADHHARRTCTLHAVVGSARSKSLP